MALKQQIEADLKTALLGGDKLAVEVLRGLKSAILYEEVAKKKRETGLDDAEIEQLFAKECKKRDESAALFEQGGNTESAKKERDEKIIIEKYLPEQITEEKLTAIIDEVIAATGASGAQAMGQVIGQVRAKVGSTADGASIARIVKQKLGA